MRIITNILPYTQIVLAVLLVVLVLIQHSDADAGGAFGGSANIEGNTHTRRGLEKTLFNTTILIAILFVISTFVALIVR